MADTDRLSAAARRKLRRQLQSSSNKCAECRTPVRFWIIPKGIPTCPNCAGTRPLGGTIERPRAPEARWPE